MKLAALLVLSALLAPGFAVIGRGASGESWHTIATGALLVALAFAGVGYLI